MVAAYAVPAVTAWGLLGLILGELVALDLSQVALVAVTVYAACYGTVEASGTQGVPVPGRSWQVPQTMLIDAPPRRRVLVWGAILGPGFLTRNPYAGFGLLPLAVAAMPGARAGLALGAAIGAAHGTARAVALLRDVRDLRAAPGFASLAAPAGPGQSPPATRGGLGSPPAGEAVAGEAVATHLDLLLKTVYWRRLDGVILLAAGGTAALALVLMHFSPN